MWSDVAGWAALVAWGSAVASLVMGVVAGQRVAGIARPRPRIVWTQRVLAPVCVAAAAVHVAGLAGDATSGYGLRELVLADEAPHNATGVLAGQVTLMAAVVAAGGWLAWRLRWGRWLTLQVASAVVVLAGGVHAVRTTPEATEPGLAGAGLVVVGAVAVAHLVRRVVRGPLVWELSGPRVWDPDGDAPAGGDPDGDAVAGGDPAGGDPAGGDPDDDVPEPGDDGPAVAEPAAAAGGSRVEQPEAARLPASLLEQTLVRLENLDTPSDAADAAPGSSRHDASGREPPPWPSPPRRPTDATAGPSSVRAGWDALAEAHPHGPQSGPGAVPEPEPPGVPMPADDTGQADEADDTGADPSPGPDTTPRSDRDRDPHPSPAGLTTNGHTAPEPAEPVAPTAEVARSEPRGPGGPEPSARIRRPARRVNLAGPVAVAPEGPPLPARTPRRLARTTAAAQEVGDWQPAREAPHRTRPPAPPVDAVDPATGEPDPQAYRRWLREWLDYVEAQP